MPNKSDIINAVNHLDSFLQIKELKGATIKKNKNGQPFFFTGGYNMVFQIAHNSKVWALRVWHVPMGKNKDRYLAISDYLTKSKLPYFADFIYDQNGLLVNGDLLDTIRMEWLDGVLIKDYIEANLTNKAKIEKLATDFIEMTKILRDNNISHGDLQEGNILIEKSGKIRLVDYDSVCIPEIEGQVEIVTGLKGYQHPSRFTRGIASLKADYFSELIIYLSIIGIAAKPELWNKYEVKDSTYLLFNENDFLNIESTRIFSDLTGINPLIDSLLYILKDYLNASYYLDLKPFTEYLIPPKIHFFKANKEIIIEGLEVELSWSSENAVNVTIEPEIGRVDVNGTFKFKPKYHTYKLVAEGYLEKAETIVELKLFPTPIIQTLLVPTPKITEELNITISIPEFSGFDISIKAVNNEIMFNHTQMPDLPTFIVKEIEPVILIDTNRNNYYKYNLKQLFSKIQTLNQRFINRLKLISHDA